MKKTDVWAEGKYLDLWSVNHFLSGVVYTGWMLVIGISIPLAFVLYFIGAVVHEFLEILREIHEHTSNKVMDVVTGLCGFALVYLVVGESGLMSERWLVSTTALYLIMEVWGYMASRRRRRS